eukprot:CAMPEP_0115854864 /NCGR_PEP_ID=MMETSP0287-20121206/14246_1 /TAXON_ID=412157 /ORGANISM="Chrysochromulina rotalis, Strain UIO044" /LENGTH=283 /DNA_ID=CAMNT_0003308999 /DNA_START=14 /DNA_END=867 /DNA_ORIENTATION=-
MAGHDRRLPMIETLPRDIAEAIVRLLPDSDLSNFCQGVYPNDESREEAIRNLAMSTVLATRYQYQGDPSTLQPENVARKHEDETWSAWLVRQIARFTSRATTPDERKEGGRLANPPPAPQYYRSLSTICEEEIRLTVRRFTARSRATDLRHGMTVDDRRITVPDARLVTAAHEVRAYGQLRSAPTDVASEGEYKVEIPIDDYGDLFAGGEAKLDMIGADPDIVRKLPIQPPPKSHARSCRVPPPSCDMLACRGPSRACLRALAVCVHSRAPVACSTCDMLACR